MKIEKLTVLFLAVLTFATLAVWSAPAQASLTFSFTDEYYVNSSTLFHKDFGSTATGYNTAGIYQNTSNTSTANVVQLSASGTGFQNVPGEFVQGSGNPTAGIVLTNFSENPFYYNSPTPKPLGNGPFPTQFGSPSNNYPGQFTIQYETGIKNPLGMTGGTAQAFNLNSINLGTISGATGYTITGSLAGTIVDTLTISTNATYNTINGVQTPIATPVTLGWTDIDKVQFSAVNPAGTLAVDNINLTPTPVPPAVWLFASGLMGLVGMRRKLS